MKQPTDSTSKKYDWLIVGAGLFGSVFACEATKRGFKCLVVDKRAHVGGNVYTEQVEGINVHRYGAHIFHTSNEKVWNYICGFCEMNDFVNSPIACYRGEHYPLPFNLNTFEKMWGVHTAEEARAIIESQRGEAALTEPKNLEEQALKLVGKDVYEKLIKGYTEKQWGRSCRDLPAFIIRRLPLRFYRDNNYFDDTHQGIPIGGYTAVIEKMLKGCDLRLCTDYADSALNLSKIANKTLYTGNIDAFFDYRLGALEYRSVRFETEVLDEKDYQGVAVMNFTDSETPYTRIIEHKHFEFGTQPKTVISREYASEWSVGGDPYYPLNNERNDELYAKYLALAKDVPNVVFGGRLGTYRYLDMDRTVASALELAEKELD